MAIFDYIPQQHDFETCHTDFLDKSLAHDIEHLLARLSQYITNKTSSSVKITMALSPTSPTTPVSPNPFNVSATLVSPCTGNTLYVPLEKSMSTPSQDTSRFASIRSPRNRSSQIPFPLSTDRSFAERMQKQQGLSRSLSSRRDSVTEYKMTLSDNENDDHDESDDLFVPQYPADLAVSTPNEYVDAASQTTSGTEITSPAIEVLMQHTTEHEIGRAQHLENLSSIHSLQNQATTNEYVSHHSTTRLPHNPLHRPDDVLRSDFNSSECYGSQYATDDWNMSNKDSKSFASAGSRFRSPVHHRPAFSKPLSSYPSEIYVPSPTTTHLQRSIAHLGTPLVPLISVTTGQPHPDFPSSLLQYHLLTHEQLDSLARWYHQTIDGGRERWLYPSWIRRPWTISNEQNATREQIEVANQINTELTAKRRRFGRFIGLRGCETPTTTEAPERMEEDETMQDQETEDGRDTEDDLAARLEREWKAALRRAEEEEKLEEKIWSRRW